MYVLMQPVTQRHLFRQSKIEAAQDDSTATYSWDIWSSIGWQWLRRNNET